MQQFNSAETHQELAAACEDAQAKCSSAVSTLQELGQSLDAVRLFVAMLANMGIGPADSFSEATYGTLPAKLELLAYHLFPFFGAEGKRDISPWDTNECIEALDTLFDARITYQMWSDTNASRDDPVERIVSDVRLHAQVLRGSAYPEQTAEEITAVQGGFDNWLASQIGISPTRAVAIVQAVVRAYQRSAAGLGAEAQTHGAETEEDYRRGRHDPPQDPKYEPPARFAKTSDAWAFGYVKRLNELAFQLLPVSCADLSDLPSPPTTEEWQSLINLVGMTSRDREAMTDPIDARQRPLFALPDGRVLLVDPSNALDVLWGRFEKAIKAEEHLFQQYQKLRSKWVEDKMLQCISRMFPMERVYRNLTYPDPEKGTSGTAELDAAVAWGPFLVLIESKARQFRLESQLGDVRRLRSDIKANIEDAFRQATRALRHISCHPNPVFAELSGGRTLNVDKGRLRRVYLVTVTLHHFADLATRLATLRALGLFEDAQYPVAMSTADLDIVSEFCAGPEVFLHYLERRVEIQRSNVYLIADEMELFGAYLSTRLRPERLQGRTHGPVGGLLLSGFQEQFDQMRLFRQGLLAQPPDIKLHVPDEIHAVLEKLRRSDDDAAKWIAFAILDLSDRCLLGIAQALRELRAGTLVPGMFRCTAFQDGDTVISITACADLSASMLYQRTEERTILEKYTRRAHKSIGFGIRVPSHQPYECMSSEEGKWEYDANIEMALKRQPHVQPAPGAQLPSRNAPCICGSGKKFKKCCLPKLRANHEDRPP